MLEIICIALFLVALFFANGAITYRHENQTLHEAVDRWKTHTRALDLQIYEVHMGESIFLKRELAEQALGSLMSGWSEDYMAAGWLSGMEAWLPAKLEDRKAQDLLTTEEETMLALASGLGYWVTYNSGWTQTPGSPEYVKYSPEA